jgi:cytochrome c biogenesis protein CcdA
MENISLVVAFVALGIPFLVIGGTFDSLTPLLKRIHRYSTAVYVFGGVLLISVGTLILTSRLVWFWPRCKSKIMFGVNYE